MATTLVGSANASAEISASAGGGRSVVGSWATAVTGPATAPQPETVFQNQTLRQIVHLSVGGNSVRLKLSNEYGDQPLVIGEARVARRPNGATGSQIAPGTDRRLTFGGRSAFTIPAGSPALSDPVSLPVSALSDLVISIYLPRRTPATTLHGSAFQTNYLAAGNVTRAASLTAATETTSWYFLSGVSVTGAPKSNAVVTLGDSITDGAITTVNANHRWPDFLARRLQADSALRRLAVLNQGIGGNRLLYNGNTLPDSSAAGLGPLFGDSALARFDRDVIARPGARYVIVLLGINDIGQPGGIAPSAETVSVDELIYGYRQIIARAHEHGLRVFGATMTPFQDAAIPGYYSTQKEAKRLAANQWIRTSGEWDGVIDFDRAVRDPDQPLRIRSAFDSGDHLHPNDAGMQAMANAIPLRFFHTAQPAPISLVS